MSEGFPLLLKLESETHSSRHWQVHPPEQLVIGRASVCDIQVDDLNVSRQHAVLSFDRGHWYCQNVSRNGTFFEDRPFETMQLHDGVVFQCCRNGPQLRVRFPSPSETLELQAPGSVSICLRLLPYGNDSAERMLWDRYFHRVTLLAKKRFGGRPRGASDEEDAAICVFQKLFDGVRQGRYPQLSDRNSLWRLLATMTHRQAGELLRHENRAKRGGGKVWREADTQQNDSSEIFGITGLPTAEPTPQDIVELGEQIELYFQKLDEELSSVALLKLQGYTNEEAAEALGVTSRTVERRLQKIRGLWSPIGE